MVRHSEASTVHSSATWCSKLIRIGRDAAGILCRMLRSERNGLNLLIPMEKIVKDVLSIFLVLPASLCSIKKPPVNNFNLEVMWGIRGWSVSMQTDDKVDACPPLADTDSNLMEEEEKEEEDWAPTGSPRESASSLQK
jgi:hypothetical protein